MNYKIGHGNSLFFNVTEHDNRIPFSDQGGNARFYNECIEKMIA